MIARAADDPPRAALRVVLQLWPWWLFWFAWTLANMLWRDALLTFPDRTAAAYAFAYRGWPAVALLGQILLMVIAIAAYRLRFAILLMPIAGIAGVVAATGWT